MHTSGLWEMKTEVCTLISAKRVDLVKVNTIGAAQKVISLFPVMPSGAIGVDKSVLQKIPKQQKKKTDRGRQHAVVAMVNNNGS